MRAPDLSPIRLSYMEKPSEYRWPFHHHRNLAEFYYVDKGRVFVRVSGKRIELGQGQGIFYLPRQRHAVEGDPNVPVNVLAIHFAPGKAFRIIPDLRKMAGMPLSPGLEGFRLLEDLTRHVNRGGKYAQLRVGVILTEFLLEMAEMHGGSGQAAALKAGLIRSRDGLVERVQVYIRENSRLSLPLARIAREIHCSVSTLVHRYRRETGETLHRFLLRCRVERAKGLLRQPGVTAKSIAKDCGFASAVALIRAFRRIEDMTPGVYRKMISG